MPKFETLVIYDEDGPIDVLYGKHSEMLRTLKKHDLWDSIAEQLDTEGYLNKINTIDELVSFYKNCVTDWTVKIKLFTEQSYKP